MRPTCTTLSSSVFSSTSKDTEASAQRTASIVLYTSPLGNLAHARQRHAVAHDLIVQDGAASSAVARSS